MKKLAVMSVALCVLAAVITGCATTAKKSPEDAIKEQIAAWKVAMEAQDIDKVMTFFSPNFEHYDWKDKAGAQAFLNDAKDMGYLEGAEILTTDMEIKLEGDKATVYPIDVNTVAGSVTLELTLANEGGTWLVVGLDAAGL